MIDILIGAGALYLVVAAIGALVGLAFFVFVFTSIVGVFKNVNESFRGFDGR